VGGAGGSSGSAGGSPGNGTYAGNAGGSPVSGNGNPGNTGGSPSSGGAPPSNGASPSSASADPSGGASSGGAPAGGPAAAAMAAMAGASGAPQGAAGGGIPSPTINLNPKQKQNQPGSQGGGNAGSGAGGGGSSGGGGGSSAGGGGGSGGYDVDPLNKMPGIPGATPRGPMPVRPGWLNKNRDWVIPIECKRDAVVLATTRETFKVEQLSANPDNALAKAVTHLIDSRQKMVPPGVPPWRPILQFQVHIDGSRTYFYAFPALDRLDYPKVRENLDLEEMRKKEQGR
jgi:hypothetical protein